MIIFIIGNETFAKIGSSATIDFIINNCDQFDTEIWDHVINLFEISIEATMPRELFVAEFPISEPNISHNLQDVITKCILHLISIEAVSEVVKNDSIYHEISSNHLMKLVYMLEKSYQFANEFNFDTELRVNLFKHGYMKQIPNLIKQETLSVYQCIGILFRLFLDSSEKRRDCKDTVLNMLIS